MHLGISFCLSVATNLRCSGLSKLQGISLLVPHAMEVLLALALVKIKWGVLRRIHGLLIAEIAVYFILVLLDYGLHESARLGKVDVSQYEVYDKAIGVVSLFPLFFYTLFLFLICQKDLLRLTSTARLRQAGQWGLLSFIPPIIIFHELAGLKGIAYAGSRMNLLVGFNSPQAQSTMLFFSSFTIGLLSGFQLLVSIGSLFYIWRVRSQGHGGGVLSGFAWLGCGLVLGGVESFMGFGGICYALIIGRSVMRLLSRAAIIIGVILGTSADEGFALFPQHAADSIFPQMRQRTQIPVRPLISNPRQSTFVHMSPGAATFNNAHYSNRGVQLPSQIVGHPIIDPLAPIQNIPPRQTAVENIPGTPLRPSKAKKLHGKKRVSGFQVFTPEQIEQVDLHGKRNRPGDRVTVNYSGPGSAPYLEMRFSDLRLPSPTVVMQNAVIKSAQMGSRYSLKHDGRISGGAADLSRLPKLQRSQTMNTFGASSQSSHRTGPRRLRSIKNRDDIIGVPSTPSSNRPSLLTLDRAEAMAAIREFASRLGGSSSYKSISSPNSEDRHHITSHDPKPSISTESDISFNSQVSVGHVLLTPTAAYVENRHSGRHPVVNPNVLPGLPSAVSPAISRIQTDFLHPGVVRRQDSHSSTHRRVSFTSDSPSRSRNSSGGGGGGGVRDSIASGSTVNNAQIMHAKAMNIRSSHWSTTGYPRIHQHEPSSSSSRIMDNFHPTSPSDETEDLEAASKEIAIPWLRHDPESETTEPNQALGGSSDDLMPESSSIKNYGLVRARTAVLSAGVDRESIVVEHSRRSLSISSSYQFPSKVPSKLSHEADLTEESESLDGHGSTNHRKLGTRKDSDVLGEDDRKLFRR
ncbi:hypothetical protein FRC02_011606 [Tulasnella sp. 418]|nr:hypothetical protein FRC02_011606 [Tulasnella sp. 418]